MFYNRTREAKKAEFLKAGKDHRGKKVTSEQDAGIAAYLYAEEDVHDRIKASGMYLDIYAELVKLVFDRGLTLEPPRNPDGTVKPIADGILGGPHTLDGLLDIPRDSSGKSPGDCALQLPAGRTAELKRSKKVQRIP
jgi:hypothetical protein